MWVDFMADALDDEPIATIKRPEGMVPVRVSSATGRATSGGSVQEYIRSEYQDMTLGPNPVKYAAASGASSRGSSRSRPGSSGGSRRSAPRRSAPRVMDELF
jgi:membrane carboxypeptidase/penicillin-binding protein